MKPLSGAVAVSAVAALVLVGCDPRTPTTGPAGSAAASSPRSPSSAGSPSTPSSASSAAAPSSSPHTSFVVGPRVQTGEGPSWLLTDGDSVIVPAGGHALARVDSSGTVTYLAQGVAKQVHPAVAPVLAFGSLWTVGYAGTNPGIVRLNPATGQIQARFQIPGRLLVATDTDIWVAGSWDDSEPGMVWRIDPVTNQVVDQKVAIDLYGGVASVAVDASSVWVVGWGGATNYVHTRERLVRIDAVTGEMTKYPVPEPVTGGQAVVAGGLLWVAGQADGPDERNPYLGSLVAFDTDGRIVRSLSLGHSADYLLTTSDGLWVSDTFDATVTLIDPTTGSIIAGPISVGTPYKRLRVWGPIGKNASAPGAMTAVGDTVWVALQNADSIVPIHPSE